MIKNNGQHKRTIAKIAELQAARQVFIEHNPNLSSPKYQLGINSFDALLEDLEAERVEYERLCAGGLQIIQPASLADIPTAIIQTRIALGLTQKDFAEKLGLKEQQIQASINESVDLYSDPYNKIEWILPNAILTNSYLITPETSPEYQKRVLEVYKKMIEKGIGSRLTTQYFTTLESFARSTNSEKEYVSEYDNFFNKTFKGTNEIEVLDEMFSAAGQSEYYNDWLGFKISYATASNQAAWFVVEKSTNPESIKKAIKWSESSLRIEKNSPYYLDTLAQLYYKNGEKQKAISTQETALKYTAEIDKTTEYEMQNVLEKMKNGTY